MSGELLVLGSDPSPHHFTLLLPLFPLLHPFLLLLLLLLLLPLLLCNSFPLPILSSLSLHLIL